MALKYDKIPPPPCLLSRRTPEKSGPFCRQVKKPYKEKAEICGHALHEYNTSFDFVFWYYVFLN